MNNKSSKDVYYDYESFINANLRNFPPSLLDQLKKHGFAINQDSASPTMAEPTAMLCAGKTQFLPQYLNQQHMGLYGQFVMLLVYYKRDNLFHFIVSLKYAV